MSDANKAVARRFYEEVISTGNTDLVGELFFTWFCRTPTWREGSAGSRRDKGSLGYVPARFSWHSSDR